MQIRYKQHSNAYAMGSDWPAGVDYGNEYANCHFRLESVGFDFPSFIFSEEDRTLFYADIKTAFESIGWQNTDKFIDGCCNKWHKGKSHLYIHPQDISGEVRKNEIKVVAEALTQSTRWKLRWVDLYQTVYDITDAEYTDYLQTQTEKIRTLVLRECRTTRTNKYLYVYNVVRKIANMVRLDRVGIDDGKHGGVGLTGNAVLYNIEQLVAQGYMVQIQQNGTAYVRTINKTEQKAKKLFIDSAE